MLMYNKSFMPSKIASLAVSVGIALSCGLARPQSSSATATQTDDPTASFKIAAGSVRLPVGAFLLIRKDGELGVIRVTSIEKTCDPELVGKSKYESYYQPDGSRSLVAKDTVRRTGDLDLRNSKGPGRGIFIYRPGQYQAYVGKWKFRFSSPNMMGMSDASFWTTLGDHGYEFAPTSAHSLSEIDATDKRLKWFRYDRNASVILPLAELPK